MREVTERFSSIHHMLDVINNRPTCKIGGCNNSSHDEDYDFTGTDSYDEAVKLITEGDKELYDEIKESLKVSENLKTKIIPIRQIKNSVVGYAPNVPNAIMGLPNSMINIEKKMMKSKTVSILYSPTENCGIRTEEFIKSGVCILNIINRLELSGYRVNLDLLPFNASDDAEKYRVYVKLKDYREHIDLLKLAFPFANPSMFRRFGFRCLETCPEIESYWFCYGHNISDEEIDFDGVYLNLSKTKECKYDTEKILKKYFSKYVN